MGAYGFASREVGVLDTFGPWPCDDVEWVYPVDVFTGVFATHTHGAGQFPHCSTKNGASDRDGPSPAKDPETPHHERPAYAADGKSHGAEGQGSGTFAFKPPHHGGGDSQEAGECCANGDDRNGNDETGLVLDLGQDQKADGLGHSTGSHDEFDVVTLEGNTKGHTKYGSLGTS